MKKIAVILGLILMLSGCSDAPDNGVIIDARDFSPIEINFDGVTGTLEEGTQALNIAIEFSRALDEDLTLSIEIDTDAILGEDFLTTPALVNGDIILEVSAGSTSASFQIGALEDNDEDEERLIFSIGELPIEGFTRGNASTFSLRLVDQAPITIAFDLENQTLQEGTATSVNINFSEILSEDLDLVVSLTSENATVTEDFDVVPTPSTDGSILVNVLEGTSQASFRIETIIDNDSNEETISFRINEVDMPGFEIVQGTFDLRIVDERMVDPRFESCIAVQSAETLEVVTWNIENFPMRGNTVDAVVDIMENMEADIIAVQEISSVSDFNEVVNRVAGWGGRIFNVRGGIELGYLYKESEITSVSNLEILFDGQNSPFPRQPVVVEMTHVNGLVVKLVNLHLKCCNDGIARRRNASDIMKNYFDANERNTNLIVLGDYNDDLDNGAPFQNFVDDTDNYRFTDLEIAMGPSSEWSFPSFPSHLDHIMVSNELFDNIVETTTLKLEDCVSGFARDVSDHRPVMTVFRAD